MVITSLNRHIHPAEPHFGITLLDPALHATAIIGPIRPWGGQKAASAWRAAHFRDFSGTWHFYLADHKFSGLQKHPYAPLKTAAPCLVEPNYSLNEDSPRWAALEATAKKRALARLWQSAGRRILVDLHVPTRHLADSLLGVPTGWPAYATRATSRDIDCLQAQHQAAQDRADGTPLVFLVLGGGQLVANYCAAHHLVYLPLGLPGADIAN